MGQFQDLTGRRFGRWVVLERGPDHITSGGNKFTTWKCKCDCGNISNVIAGRLLSGRSLSCGCLQQDIASRHMDLSGNKYGKLTVMKLDLNNTKRIHYLCRCDCGKIISVRADSLKSGAIKSCGCLSKERAREQGLKNTKHGGNRRLGSKEERRLYGIWSGMKSRCRNMKEKSYKNYGGRGIDYCEEWNEFAPFQQWALSNGYANNLTLDRIDNNEGYNPDNCRWVDYTAQNNNRTNSIHLVIDGIDHTLSEWCRISGISYKVAYARYRNGWDANSIIFNKVRKNE